MTKKNIYIYIYILFVYILFVFYKLYYNKTSVVRNDKLSTLV